MKINDDKAFNDWLTNKTANYAVEPDDQTWIGIQNHLQKKKKKRPFIFWWMPIAASLIIGSTSFYYFKIFNKKSITSTAIQSSKNNTSYTNKSIADKKSIIKQHTETTSYSATTKKGNNNNIASLHINEQTKTSLIIDSLKDKRKISFNNHSPSIMPLTVNNKKRKYQTNKNKIALVTRKDKPRITKIKDNSVDININNNTHYTSTSADFTKELNSNEYRLIASRTKIDLYDLPSRKQILLRLEKETDSILPFTSKYVDSNSTTKKNKLKNRIEYEFFFIPTYSYKTEKIDLSKPTPINISADILSAYNIKEFIGEQKTKGNAGLNIGMNVNIPIQKGVFFQTGFRFEQAGYIIHANQIHSQKKSGSNNLFAFISDDLLTPPFTKNINDSSFYVTNETLKNKFYNFQIPVNMGYKIHLPKNYGIYLSSGITLEYHFSKNTQIYSPEYKSYFSDKKTISKFNLSSETNLNALLPISSKLSIIIGPTFRYQILSSFKKDYLVKENLYSVGCKIGINFK
jgi:hypothetical protein